MSKRTNMPKLEALIRHGAASHAEAIEAADYLANVARVLWWCKPNRNDDPQVLDCKERVMEMLAESR